jgi:hypothetical protein
MINLGIFNGYLEYFKYNGYFVIVRSFGIFPVLVYLPRQIWQPWWQRQRIGGQKVPAKKVERKFSKKVCVFLTTFERTELSEPVLAEKLLK